jgi:hypothetical protein
VNRFGENWLTEEGIFLCNAADILRRSVETFECSLFSSLPGINNIYILNIYKYIENQCFVTLRDKQVDDKMLITTFGDTCCKFWKEQDRMTGFNPASKLSAFVYDLSMMVNVLYFDQENMRPSPELDFIQAIWMNYKKNWNSIRPL